MCRFVLNNLGLANLNIQISENTYNFFKINTILNFVKSLAKCQKKKKKKKKKSLP